MAKVRSQPLSNAGFDMDSGNSCALMVEGKLLQPFKKIVWQYLAKLNMYVPPRFQKNSCTCAPCTRMLVAELFVIMCVCERERECERVWARERERWEDREVGREREEINWMSIIRKMDKVCSIIHWNIYGNKNKGIRVTHIYMDKYEKQCLEN